MASDAATSEGPVPQQLSVINLLLAVAPIALFAWAYQQNPVAAMRSYLWAFCVVAAVPCGSLPLLALQHLTGGAWGVTLRRPLEAAVRTMPLVALLFVPIALSAKTLYPWANGEYTVPHPKDLYLNLDAFLIRAAVYFVIWMLLGTVLCYWSGQQDRSNPPGFDRRYRLIAGPTLGLYGLSITFASIDWVMSLEPTWFSSIYGVLFGVGQILSAFAFAILIVLANADQRPLRGVIRSGHYRDYGSLLLAFVMIWMYLSISQFILIWSANIKEEAPYYTARAHGIWPILAAAVVLAQFFVPFLVLLTRDGKRNARSLGWVAAMVLIARAVELYWFVAPARPVDHHTMFWSDLVAVPALALPWSVFFGWQLSRRPLLPVNVDPTPAEDHHG